jgi:hypothetical protein
LIGVLLTLLVLGGLAIVVLMALPSATGSSKATSGAGATALLPGNAAPSVGNDITAASAATCHANYAAAKSAIDVYEAEHGTLPTTIAEVQTLLRDPLSTNRFTITIDPRRPGELQVATNAHPAADGDTNCAYAG